MLKTNLATKPMIKGRTSEGTSEKSRILTPALLEFISEPNIQFSHNLDIQLISSSSVDI